MSRGVHVTLNVLSSLLTHCENLFLGPSLQQGPIYATEPLF